MSMPQDVLDTIGPGGIPKEQLLEKVGNIGQADLDNTLNQLMRAGRVRLAFGRYETIELSKAKSVPTAEEEAEANLRPAPRTCDRCGVEKDLNKENFSSNRHGFLKICKRCYSLAVSAGSKGKIIPVATPQNKVPATPGATLTGEGSHPPAGEPSRSRELRPVPDGVYERAKAKRAAALNRIAVLEVDLANERTKAAECDRFLELYEHYAREPV